MWSCICVCYHVCVTMCVLRCVTTCDRKHVHNILNILLRRGLFGLRELITWGNLIIERKKNSTNSIVFCFFFHPQIAAKVAAPLARTNEIIIMSGDSSRVNGEVAKLLAELPVTVNALTGVDVLKVTPPTHRSVYPRSHDQRLCVS